MGRKLHQELRGIREVINVFKKTKKKVPTQWWRPPPWA